jgi:ABC-2 type transport system ATP-binding protein
MAAVHQLADAEKIADRILILRNGRAVAWGSLGALRQQAGLPDASLEQIFIAILTEKHHAP